MINYFLSAIHETRYCLISAADILDSFYEYHKAIAAIVTFDNHNSCQKQIKQPDADIDKSIIIDDQNFII